MKRRRQVPPNQLQNDPTTGSPSPGEPVFLAIGRLRRPHGVRGEMLMDVLTGFPERIRPGRKVYVGEVHELLQIASLRGHDREMIIRFSGFSTPEEAGRLRNALVYVKASDLPELPEGEYYHHQLLGLSVVDEAGQHLGILTEILETGANDIYLVKTPDEKELLLPVIEEVILSVDLEQGVMRVRPQEWG